MTHSQSSASKLQTFTARSNRADLVPLMPSLAASEAAQYPAYATNGSFLLSCRITKGAVCLQVFEWRQGIARFSHAGTCILTVEQRIGCNIRFLFRFSTNLFCNLYPSAENCIRMVEYVDQYIHTLSWQITSKSADITSEESCGDSIISGSKTLISIWQFHDDPGSFDQLPIIEVASENIKSRASRVHHIGKMTFTALIDGTVLLHEVVTKPNGRQSLSLISESTDLHKSYKCNDMLFCPQLNSVITCGNDGALAMFNIEKPKKISRKPVSKSSLTCLDMVNPNEVICGSLNGTLKHFDIRTDGYIGSYSNKSLSTLMCVQRNPHVNHLAIGGNDQGSIVLYDLRNVKSAVAEISAHRAAVTNVRYRPKDPNIVYSSSVDGDLFRWNLTPEFLVSHIPRKIESIGCTSDPLSITSFDVNYFGDMIYTADHGAIFYKKLNELGS